MRESYRREQLRRWAIAAGTTVFIGVIVWLDITSGLWQEVVILSGLAAGLVMFLLTALVLDRIVERSTARRWAPVNRLAFSAFLHAVADDERSEISRGEIVARSIPALQKEPQDDGYLAELHELRQKVVEEREMLSTTLGQWAHFLASSGDNVAVLSHIAAIALRLDRIRDGALDAEMVKDHASLAALNAEIREANEGFTALVAELKGRVADTGPRLSRTGLKPAER